MIPAWKGSSSRSFGISSEILSYPWGYEKEGSFHTYGGMKKKDPFIPMGVWNKRILSYPWGYEIKGSFHTHGGMKKKDPFIPMGVWNKRILSYPWGYEIKMSRTDFFLKRIYLRHNLSNILPRNNIFLQYFQAYTMSFRSCSDRVWPFLQGILSSSWVFPAECDRVPLKFLWQETCGILRFRYDQFPTGILLPPSEDFPAGSASFCYRKLRDWPGKSAVPYRFQPFPQAGIFDLGYIHAKSYY